MKFKFERFVADGGGMVDMPALHFTKNQLYFNHKAVKYIKSFIGGTKKKVLFWFDGENKVLAFCFFDAHLKGARNISLPSRSKCGGVPNETWSVSARILFQKYPIISLLARLDTHVCRVHTFDQHMDDFEDTQMFAVDFNKPSLFDKGL